jgi:transglutaminase-like putative cysteine protease
MKKIACLFLFYLFACGICHGDEIPGFTKKDFETVYDDFSEQHKNQLIQASLKEKPTEKKTYPSETIYKHIYLHLKKDGSSVEYWDYAQKINAPSTKDSLGEQKIYYDSSQAKVDFLKAAVYVADGKEIETDLTTAKIKEPYTGLVYSDLKMKILTMKGVETGAAIRTAYVKTDKRGEEKDFIFEEISLDTYEPLVEKIVVIRIEAGTPVKKMERIHDQIPEFQNTYYTLENGDGVYIFKLVRRKVDEFEFFSIPFNEYMNRISLVTPNTWRDVAIWYYSRSKDKMTADKDIIKKVKDLVKDKSKGDEKIKVLYDYVKDLRYVSIALNQHRLIPHQASDTFKNRYGDCKDKSTLLIAMLKSLGINAYIALIDTGNLVDVDLPTPLTFNHAIVAIPDGQGKYQFLDATSKTPYGFLTPYIQYRNALVVKEDGGELVLIPAEDPEKTKEDDFLKIDLHNLEAVNLALKAVSNASSYLEEVLKTVPERQFKKLLQLHYSQLLKTMNVEINSVKYEKQKEGEKFILSIDMTIGGFMTVMGNLYAFAPLKLFDPGILNMIIASKERKKDIELSPSKRTVEVIIDIPEKTAIEFLPQNFSIRHEKFGEYEYIVTKTHKTIRIGMVFLLKQKRIAATDYSEFKKFLTQIIEQNNQNILLKKKTDTQ